MKVTSGIDCAVLCIEMPKKKKKPSSKAKRHKPATEQTKPVPKRRKIGIEIDEIFGGRMKKKPEVEDPEKKETPMERTKIPKRKRKRKRKRTEDGLLVFTEDELGINKANAGGTRRCPFKCLCCR